MNSKCSYDVCYDCRQGRRVRAPGDPHECFDQPRRDAGAGGVVRRQPDDRGRSRGRHTPRRRLTTTAQRWVAPAGARSMTTIVLADDHALIREGLRTVLGGELDWSVVVETADGLQTVALVAQMDPDVLIVDLMLPGLSGQEVIRQVWESV